MELLLIGLDRLKGNPFSSLNIDYADMLSKIFADSQNFDKAIYYNKIALQKSYLTKDTIGITKSLSEWEGSIMPKMRKIVQKCFLEKSPIYPLPLKQRVRIANAHNNLGVIAQNNDNFDLAKSSLKKH